MTIFVDRAHAHALASTSGRHAVRVVSGHGRHWRSRMHQGHAALASSQRMAGIRADAAPSVGMDTTSGGDRAWREGWSLVTSFNEAGSDGDFYSW